MMEGVKRGGNRQELHEIVRICSMNATTKMKNGEQWDLLADLSSHPEFGMTKAEMEAVLEPTAYIGRCPEQVDSFLAGIRHQISDITKSDTEIDL
jgi:adenylosuccinate lyase